MSIPNRGQFSSLSGPSHKKAVSDSEETLRAPINTNNQNLRATENTGAITKLMNSSSISSSEMNQHSMDGSRSDYDSIMTPPTSISASQQFQQLAMRQPILQPPSITSTLITPKPRTGITG